MQPKQGLLVLKVLIHIASDFAIFFIHFNECSLPRNLNLRISSKSRDVIPLQMKLRFRCCYYYWFHNPWATPLLAASDADPNRCIQVLYLTKRIIWEPVVIRLQVGILAMSEMTRWSWPKGIHKLWFSLLRVSAFPLNVFNFLRYGNLQ